MRMPLTKDGTLPNLETLGQRILWARERAGYTQESLGEVLGSQQTTVGKWELNKSVPRKITKISEVLKVSPAWLQFGVAAIDKLSPETIQIALELESKSSKAKEAVRNIIKTMK